MRKLAQRASLYATYVAGICVVMGIGGYIVLALYLAVMGLDRMLAAMSY